MKPLATSLAILLRHTRQQRCIWFEAESVYMQPVRVRLDDIDWYPGTVKGSAKLVSADEKNNKGSNTSCISIRDELPFWYSPPCLTIHFGTIVTACCLCA